MSQRKLAIAPVVKSMFADETTKDPMEQVELARKHGCTHITPRMVDKGCVSARGEPTGEVVNVVALEYEERKRYGTILADGGIGVASIGSALGKLPLFDGPSMGTQAFVSWPHYLEEQVTRMLDACSDMNVRLIRGFTFYGKIGESAESRITQVAERLCEFLAVAKARNVVLAIEVEGNLVGRRAVYLAAICSLVRSWGYDNFVLVFDGGNLVAQGLRAKEVFDEFVIMSPFMGYLHAKDLKWRESYTKWPDGKVDEAALRGFCPIGEGDGAYRNVLKHAVSGPLWAQMTARMQAAGAPGVFIELEPHMDESQATFGKTQPEQMAKAAEGLDHLLAEVGIPVLQA